MPNGTGQVRIRFCSKFVLRIVQKSEVEEPSGHAVLSFSVVRSVLQQLSVVSFADGVGGGN